jgi:hypothetical protein
MISIDDNQSINNFLNTSTSSNLSSTNSKASPVGGVYNKSTPPKSNSLSEIANAPIDYDYANEYKNYIMIALEG